MSRPMKDSGIAWIGQVPEHWEQALIGSLYKLRNTKVSDKQFEPLSVTMRGILHQLENAAKTNDGDNRKLVKQGDFVINSRSDRRGACGISKYDGSVSLINLVLVPQNHMNPGYYNWLFHTSAFADEFYKWGHGIVDDLWTTRWQDMKNITIPLPSLQEQQRIADYLDKKCAEVEGLSSNIQKQIEALEQYKRAVITETVTKGLNPSVPMKDSGIPWVGQSPAHWGIKRIKFCCELSPKFHNKLSPNTLVSFLPMECVKQGFLVIEKEAELQDVKNGYTYFRENDIIMAKVTPCFENGNIAIAKGLLNNVGFGSSELYVFRPHKISVPFLFYFLQNTIFKNQAQSVMYGTGGLKRVPSEFIKNYQFACPPQSEQQAIAEYLDNKCSKIDTIIQDKQQQLEKLEQYKKAIIFEYVTGKKQVPEA
ncbi:restriction endonuclease subunit S [Candidatus Avelusimicrobium stercoris]|uniref:restriction endonuclease subunit S n=1 Tax=Candidatus Avelusimicrobium stercoris TaxID=1947924 RepID=UPI003D0F42D7